MSHPTSDLLNFPPMKHLRLLLLFTLPLLAGSAAAGKASAQTYTCARDTSEATVALRDYVVRLVTATDSVLVATRNRYRLPAAASSAVTVVTTTKTCGTAGQAYERALNPAGTSAVSRSMVVIKIGTTRYAIIDPKERNGEFEVNMITDASFIVLAMFGS